jgi:large conductance mechanosensitive channel
MSEGVPLLQRQEVVAARQMVGDFRSFLLKGNIVDLAIAVILGAAFQATVSSFTTDLLMPPVGILTGSNLQDWFYVIKKAPSSTENTTYNTTQQAHDDGAVTINPGRFLQSAINFLVIGLVLYAMVQTFIEARKRLHLFEKKAVNGEERTTKSCLKCYTDCDSRATICKACHSPFEIVVN